jgi:hypothetical protein
MSKMVITHAVVDIERWLQGAGARAGPVRHDSTRGWSSGRPGRHVVRQVTERGGTWLDHGSQSYDPAPRVFSRCANEDPAFAHRLGSHVSRR